MHFDFTKKTAIKKHHRRVTIAVAASVFAGVMCAWEVAMLIKVGFL